MAKLATLSLPASFHVSRCGEAVWPSLYGRRNVICPFCSLLDHEPKCNLTGHPVELVAHEKPENCPLREHPALVLSWENPPPQPPREGTEPCPT